MREVCIQDIGIFLYLKRKRGGFLFEEEAIFGILRWTDFFKK